MGKNLIKLIMIYKRNYLKAVHSNLNMFWFKSEVNGLSYGDHKSEESAIDFGKYLVDKAIATLSKLDGNTVIDSNLLNNLDISHINSLVVLTGYKDYQIFLAKFEGDSIKFFLMQYE